VEIFSAQTQRSKSALKKYYPDLYFYTKKNKILVELIERSNKRMLVEPRPKGKHFTKDDRVRIEALYKAGHTQREIAQELGCTQPAICYELKKGQVDQLDGATWIMYKTYDAYAAQQHAEYQYTAHSNGLKIGNNHSYVKAIAECISMGYSPYAAIQKVGNTYGVKVTKQTMYRYIAEGLIPKTTYKNLPVGHRKKRKKKVESTMRSRSLDHRSIERRAKIIMKRDTFGHWEIDSIIGTSEGKNESCLVLTERYTREEIVIKVEDKTADSTTRAMQKLKEQLGEDFNKIFFTITLDNGSEFADQNAFDALGVPAFYCHPGHPYERGSNENNNKLLRRHFPKGQSMKHKTQYDATQAQYFINGYPREMFNGRCSNDLFREQLEQINLSDKQRIYNFFNI
jgi:IS30 family transposase